VKLRDAWDEVSKIGKNLDVLEVRAREALQWPAPKGRELPYFFSEQIVFAANSLEPVSAVLVQPSNRETKITRISLDVFVEVNSSDGATQNRYPLRPSRAGMFNRLAGTPTNDTTGVALFDFVWTFSLGSTERKYTNGRVQTDGLWNARQALGNQERDSQLLFSPRNPLIVDASEFLTFSVKPILYNPATSLDVYTDALKYVVAFQCVGTRTFTYDT
jgi:hypothetical protein